MTPAASPPLPGEAGPGRYLTFALGCESYGLPVLSVREIIRLCPITPVPQMPARIRGVINLRGKVIPILDLRAKFKLAGGTYGDRACIIVLQFGAVPAGLTLVGAIVDAVEEVVLLTAAELEPAPDFGGSPDNQYISGMAKVHGGVKTLLNLERIFLEEGPVLLPPTAASNSESPTT
ncbi:MAG: purine-binding chemotaxis protein CheW [Verrucomicrobiae bacterium]|nr:purine-binding chemotaxis protein CheW [Verrucomicrobiae bacterium]